jgi:hypothetical protein
MAHINITSSHVTKASNAARVKPVPCPCVASPPLLFSRTPSLARLMPSFVLLPRVQCAANLPVCAFTRAPGHARNSSAGAPGPLPPSPPGRIRGKLRHGRSPPRGALPQLLPACVRGRECSSLCPRVPAALQLHLRHVRASVRPCRSSVMRRLVCSCSARTWRPPRRSCASSRALRLPLSLEHDPGLCRPPLFPASSPTGGRGSAPLFSMQAPLGHARCFGTPPSHLHALARTPACSAQAPASIHARAKGSALTSHSPLCAPPQHAARPKPDAHFLWLHAPEPRAFGSNHARLKKYSLRSGLRG